MKNMKFYRTDKPITAKHVEHNIMRWEWIGKEGKTFAEIDAQDSFYRKCIRRPDFDITKHQSIKRDLDYDLKEEMIRAVEII